MKKNRSLQVALAATLFAAAAMAVALTLLAAPGASLLAQVLYLSVISASGLLAYGAAVLALRSPERALLAEAWNALRAGLRRPARKPRP